MATSKKAAPKKAAAKKSGTKRTEIAPNGDKRYIRRNAEGQIRESDDEGKSLSQDVRQHSKTAVEPGQGDKGDQQVKKASPKKASPKKSAAKKSKPGK